MLVGKSKESVNINERQEENGRCGELGRYLPLLKNEPRLINTDCCQGRIAV